MSLQKSALVSFFRRIKALTPFGLFGNNVPPPAPKDSDDHIEIDSVTQIETRPHIRLDRLIFKDGTRIQMNPHEIVIVSIPRQSRGL